MHSINGIKNTENSNENGQALVNETKALIHLRFQNLEPPTIIVKSGMSVLTGLMNRAKIQKEIL